MAGSGQTLTYGELDERSRRLAALLHARGLRPGDSIAFCLENRLEFFEVLWAARRSGLSFTPVSFRFTPDEVRYVVDDCDARLFITTAARRDTADLVAREAPGVEHVLLLDEPPTVDGDRLESYEQALGTALPGDAPEYVEGVDMLYSSGTTGHPKGVRRPLETAPAAVASAVTLVRDVFGCDEQTVFLVPSPLYHGHAMILSSTVHLLGGTLVVMERFDPAAALAALERHRVTHSLWVPTMFIRLLKLPAGTRDALNSPSHRLAIHGAGPCPVEVKQQMIDWWGPILFDYYSGTEGAGVCAITSAEWLTHRGSVGRAVLGHLHVLDDEGRECPPGTPGVVYFSGGSTFAYHKDDAKTAASRSREGWATLGDIGYVDDEGYLYLTDRTAFTIVSGGLNIYPQEIEDVLVMHPRVADVAVFGVPHEDLVEQAVAVVQPQRPEDAGPDLAQELLTLCRRHLASYKVPRELDFQDELPRHPTGKLYKRELRERYLAARASSPAPVASRG
jgi:acyl-CoA synthetase (AMP-forming)/AMP-acid ligase II